VSARRSAYELESLRYKQDRGTHVREPVVPCGGTFRAVLGGELVVGELLEPGLHVALRQAGALELLDAHHVLPSHPHASDDVSAVPVDEPAAKLSHTNRVSISIRGVESWSFGHVLGERRGVPARRHVPLDAVRQGELRAHGLDAVELDEAAVEAEAPGGGGVPVPAPAVVEHGVERARGDLPRQRQRLVHLLRHLGEGEHVGAEPRALALVGDDPRRRVPHHGPARQGQVAGSLAVHQQPPRRLGARQAEVVREVVPAPDCGHGRLRRGLRRHAPRAGAPHRLCPHRRRPSVIN
jgi:hypothetical protein